MPVYHTKAELWEEIKRMPAKMLEDGILLDCPKDRRRRQAKGEKPVRFTVPMEVGKRFAIQIERYLRIFGNKTVAWDVMTTTIEGPSDDLLMEVANESRTEEDQAAVTGDAGGGVSGVSGADDVRG